MSTQTTPAGNTATHTGGAVRPMVPYLCFDGNCHEAMRFYQEALRCELHAMKFGDAPLDSCAGGQKMDAATRERVMHARLTRGGEMILMASDGMPGTPLVTGNNFWVQSVCDSADEVDRLFKLFGEGCKATMEPQETFWASRFCMVADRYGIQWMFIFGEKAVSM